MSVALRRDIIYKKLLILLFLPILTSLVSLACGGAEPESNQQGAAQTVSPLTQEERLYTTTLLANLRSLDDGLAKIADLLDSAIADPALLRDDRWKLSVAPALWQIQESSALIKRLTPPARFGDSHSTMIEAANHYGRAVDLMAAGLDTRSGSKLEAANQEMLLGRNALSRAVAQMERAMGTSSGAQSTIPAAIRSSAPTACSAPPNLDT